MEGMFYSLEEIIEKFSKTKEEITELVKEGKLQEFRHGSHLMFKIDEVEALLSDTSAISAPDSSSETPIEEGDDIALIPDQADTTVAGEVSEAATITGEEEIGLAHESEAGVQPSDDISGKTVSDLDETLLEAETPPVPESTEEIIEDLAAQSGEGVTGDLASESAEALLADTASESGEGLSADTVSELGESGLGETAAESAEASLEEIEEDVNLDTFGSGSGLLDLSLQADDTSLGGILDEIYTSDEEGAEGEQEASVMDVAAETEQMLAKTLPTGLEEPMVSRTYLEPEPDSISNAFGIVLFLPLIAIIYTAIVVVPGFNKIMPTVLEPIQGMIWYILAGLAVLALLVIGMPFMLSGKSSQAGTKEKKAKKKKEKKPKRKPKKKKGKKAKAPPVSEDEAAE